MGWYTILAHANIPNLGVVIYLDLGFIYKHFILPPLTSLDLGP